MPQRMSTTRHIGDVERKRKRLRQGERTLADALLQRLAIGQRLDGSEERKALPPRFNQLSDRNEWNDAVTCEVEDGTKVRRPRVLAGRDRGEAALPSRSFCRHARDVLRWQEVQRERIVGLELHGGATHRRRRQLGRAMPARLHRDDGPAGAASPSPCRVRRAARSPETLAPRLRRSLHVETTASRTAHPTRAGSDSRSSISGHSCSQSHRRDGLGRAHVTRIGSLGRGCVFSSRCRSTPCADGGPDPR